jgi:uncharacterized Ntn-hydrolase superfamily protein
MTFSITGRCARTGQLGVAAVTAMPGVGQLVTWGRPRVGAVATQSWVNPYLAIDGLMLLDRGYPPDKALEAVLLMDPQPELRQVGLVDWTGESAAFTGEACEGWAGHESGPGWSVQGNLIAGPATMTACRDAFQERAEDPLVERLICALEEGQARGGDRRGSRSAAVYVLDAQDFPLWDLRIDDQAQPVQSLRALRDEFARSLMPQIDRLPRRDRSQRPQGDDEQGLV